ncbi:MAG: molybdate ABC transporter substrate-binding protein [Armatimonadota bacterium]
MPSLWRAFPILLAISLAAGCGGARPGPSQAQTARGSRRQTGPITLVAFVGSASKPPASEAKEAYQKANPGVSVDMTFGGSGTLLQQMTLEKTGDIYMPGSDDYMDKAEAKQAVIPETRAIVAYLVPMICVQKGNPKGIKELADLARPGLVVGLAEPGAVCLGDASAEILENAGLLASVRKNVITYAKSCEQTQQLVQLAEVDAIIGWDAFAKWAPDKIEVIPIPQKYGRPRNIPAAVSAFSRQKKEAAEFIGFLTSPQGKAIFAKHGYSVEPPKQ